MTDIRDRRDHAPAWTLATGAQSDQATPGPYRAPLLGAAMRRDRCSACGLPTAVHGARCHVADPGDLGDLPERDCPRHGAHGSPAKGCTCIGRSYARREYSDDVPPALRLSRAEVRAAQARIAQAGLDAEYGRDGARERYKAQLGASAAPLALGGTKAEHARAARTKGAALGFVRGEASFARAIEAGASGPQAATVATFRAGQSKARTPSAGGVTMSRPTVARGVAIQDRTQGAVPRPSKADKTRARLRAHDGANDHAARLDARRDRTADAHGFYDARMIAGAVARYQASTGRNRRAARDTLRALCARQGLDFREVLLRH